MKIALVFPGQGSQKPGMGKQLAADFAAARRVFEEVDDALGDHLSRTVFEGAASDLVRTDVAQPALMAVSMAALAVLRDAGLDPARDAHFVAGHSLGEYTALAAAGSISLADAARTLRARGLAMQKAAPGDAGTMAAVLGLDDFAKVEELARGAAAASGKVCVIANDNAPGQVVLSGHTPAIAQAELLAKDVGAKRVIRLEVAAAFHSPLMAPAAREMERVLAAVAFLPPRPTVVANVTAAPVRDSDKIAGLLVQQITNRVRWRESVAAMAAAGADTQVEVGSGKVLTGLVKRIAPDMKIFAVETAADIEAFDKARKGS
jgi:[acyl-carrier-protein] S-malonyltransferase